MGPAFLLYRSRVRLSSTFFHSYFTLFEIANLGLLMHTASWHGTPSLVFLPNDGLGRTPEGRQIDFIHGFENSCINVDSVWTHDLFM